MAFVDTLDSLQRNLAPTVDLSNYVTSTSLTETLDTRLAKSLGQLITVSPDSNNVCTINPNLGSMFLVAAYNSATINIISNIDQDFTINEQGSTTFSTGSVISIFVMVPENITITWPSNISWADGPAPTLATTNDSKINLITLVCPFTDDEVPLWFGGCTPFTVNSV